MVKRQQFSPLIAVLWGSPEGLSTVVKKNTERKISKNDREKISLLKDTPRTREDPTKRFPRGRSLKEVHRQRVFDKIGQVDVAGDVARGGGTGPQAQLVVRGFGGHVHHVS